MKDMPRWLKVVGAVIVAVVGLLTIGVIRVGWASPADLKAIEIKADQCCGETAYIRGKLELIHEDVKALKEGKK